MAIDPLPLSTASVPTTPRQRTAAVILVDHGSKRAAANEMLDEVARQLDARIPNPVYAAHMELAEPSIADACNAAIAGGARFVFVFPYFLSPGRHSQEDIPQLVAEAMADHADVGYHVSGPIGIEATMLELIEQRIAHCNAHGFGSPGCAKCPRTCHSRPSPDAAAATGDWQRVDVTPDSDLAAILADVQPRTVLRLAPGRYEVGQLAIATPQITLEAAVPGNDTNTEVTFWQSSVNITADGVRVRGLTFRQAMQSAITIDEANDVAITDCRFVACGLDGGNVTLWIGNHTRGCSVQNCLFDRLGARGPRHRIPGRHVYDIAIMTGETDCQHHRFARNTIRNYGYGIQLGVTGTCQSDGHHHVVDNVIESPTTDGIHIKQRRVRVERNRIVGATVASMSARAGGECAFVDNVCEDGFVGMRVRGDGHAIVGNAFIRQRCAALVLCNDRGNGDAGPAGTVRIDGNTIEDCPLAIAVAAGTAVLGQGPRGENTLVRSGEAMVRIADSDALWDV